MRIKIPKDKIDNFCRQYFIIKLSFFGSVLRDDFSQDSDIDILVEFEKDKGPGFLELAHMERELTELLGKKVDLRTPNEISKYFKEQVLSLAQVHYVQR